MRRALKIAAWCAAVAAVFPAAVISVRAWVNTASADRVLQAKIGVPSYPPSGTVDGTVIDEEGKPVAGATVSAYVADRPFQGVAPHRQTDATGHFAISGLSWGEYRVAAAKVDEGYPEMLLEFFARNHPIQKVKLDPGHAIATVTIRLGPKAGRVTGTVTDARTSALLPNPLSELKWASDPPNYMAGGFFDAKFSILIPSNTDVLWKVWRNGYKTWYYPGTTDESAATALRLRPGEATSIAIRLQPDAAAKKTGRRP